MNRDFDKAPKPGHDSMGKVPGADVSALRALCGGRIEAVSSLSCNGLSREDVEFLVLVLRESDLPLAEEDLDELWRWLTSAPHDIGFARAPTDEALMSLVGEGASWDVGRRALAGRVEYYATFRIERGAWLGMSFTVSHIEGADDNDRVFFSASVGDPRKPEEFPREERVNRLVRLCGLTNFKAGRDGADIVARSSTFIDADEFCIFLE